MKENINWLGSYKTAADIRGLPWKEFIDRHPQFEHRLKKMPCDAKGISIKSVPAII